MKTYKVKDQEEGVTYKVKDQEEGVKNAKLFYEAVKLAWGLQVTYCYHDLIHDKK